MKELCEGEEVYSQSTALFEAMLGVFRSGGGSEMVAVEVAMSRCDCVPEKAAMREAVKRSSNVPLLSTLYYFLILEVKLFIHASTAFISK